MFKYISNFSFLFSPELAHYFFLRILKFGVINQEFSDEALKINLWGKNFINPLGLAAGFDKNAEVISGILKMGFGFAELGTVTPKPQIGNVKPRVFRIPEYEAVIQRLGFNNKGLDFFINNISEFKKINKGIIGANIGKNKDSNNYLDDYNILLTECSKFADYVVVNISSPNTPGLRDIQKKDRISFLLKELNIKNIKKVPLLLKIAPDISNEDLENICNIALKEDWLSGLVISNTTILRDSIRDKPIKNAWKIKELGGLSGPPLYRLSNEILKKTYKLTKGKVPLIGVGGISSGEDAFEKIGLGASLIQIYTSLIYKGPEVIIEILKELRSRLKLNGFKNIKSAVGFKVK